MNKIFLEKKSVIIKKIIQKSIHFIVDIDEWKIFLKRVSVFGIIGVLLAIFWLFPVSLFVAPFYSFVTSSFEPISKDYKLEGKATVLSIENGLQGLLDKGLVTNFVGVKSWIDNNVNEQTGEIEIYRVAINALANNLGRNRGTGGANKNLMQARSAIYSDYNRPFFTSYSTRLEESIVDINNYLNELEENKNIEMSKKKAVFIVNPNNLGEAIDKVKQQIQTNLVTSTTFFTEDDKFYRIRGNLIATYYFLSGVKFDYKEKMINKSSYEENFIPILEYLEKAIAYNPMVVSEFMGDVSKIEKNANVIAQKLAELRGKLRND